MQFDGNYIQRGTIDVSNIVDALSDLSDEDWAKENYRQMNFAVHCDTNTIPLLFDGDFRHAKPTRCENSYRFQDVIVPVYTTIASYFGNTGRIIRSLFVRLRAGGTVPLHRDRGYSLENSHRLHIPIVTNNGASYSVGGEERHMESGDVWEINNQRKHAAWNRGTDGRIHLICDWVNET